MALKNDSPTLATSINDVLDKKRKPLFIGFIVVIVAVLGTIIGIVVKENVTAKNLESIDMINYEMRLDASSLSSDEIASRRSAALEKLAPLTAKSGIVGARASIISAELYFQTADFEKARDLFVKAADLRKKAYFAPDCYFNAGVCSENLGDNENALLYYKKAGDYSDYLLIDHVLFNIGRLNEALGDLDSAKASYEKLNDLHPTSNWAKLAKSRILTFKVSSQI